MSQIQTLDGVMNKVLVTAYSSLLEPEKSSNVFTFPIPTLSIDPITEFSKLMVDRLTHHHQYDGKYYKHSTFFSKLSKYNTPSGNMKIVIFTHTDNEVNEIEKFLSRNAFDSIAFCVSSNEMYGKEENAINDYNKNKKNVIVLRQESLAGKNLSHF